MTSASFITDGFMMASSFLPRCHCMPIFSRSSTASVTCTIAALCALIACASLLGWTLGIEALTSVFPGYPSMSPITAGLTLLGAGTLALRPFARRSHAGSAAGALLVAVSLAVLAIHATAHWNDVLSAIAGNALPWRLPAPLTAIMFFATGVSLLALASPRHVGHAQWLALGVLFLASLTLAGYLFRETYLYQTLPGTGTSILTTVALAMLAAGCLGARPRDGIMAAVTGATHGAQVARRLLWAAIALPVALGIVVWSTLHLDLVDINTAIALLVWGIAAMIVVVTWLGAVSLHRVDSARRQAEQALSEALASLREADAHKDHFLAVLAHELRNPLAPIRAAADLLLLPVAVDAARQRRAGGIILRQVATMTNLVEDLLDLSRVRQGVLSAEQVPVDLCLVIHDALEQTAPLIAQRRHQLDTVLPATHPLVPGDHKRLVQVVANLLVNAAKYTPEGGTIALTLRTDGVADITVADNGIGIAPAMLDRIFDSFAQAERTPGRTVGGLGIGLALVKSLVNLHGGTIAAHSAGLGRGSTLIVSLPVRQAATATAAAQPLPSQSAP
jgi:signal transduction histidine kinase